MAEFAALQARTGDYTGEGVNHAGQRYRAELSLRARLGDKALAVTARAVGLADGEVYHEEESTVARGGDGALALWVLSSNHPGLVEHAHDPTWPTAAGAERTVAFRQGDPADRASFREVVCFDLWPDGAITHRYAWGLPGGDFAERSGARLAPSRRQPVPQAALERSEHGRAPTGAGWFVTNLAEAKWVGNDRLGRACTFEGPHRFGQFGINVHVLRPGEPACMYHGEADQEAFLVLHGHCLLIVEGQERALTAGDFVHCPPWTRHVFVGAGDGPCAVLMVGGRARDGVVYPLDPAAQRYGACPERACDSPREAYAGLPPLAEVPSPWPL